MGPMYIETPYTYNLSTVKERMIESSWLGQVLWQSHNLICLLTFVVKAEVLGYSWVAKFHST